MVDELVNELKLNVAEIDKAIKTSGIYENKEEKTKSFTKFQFYNPDAKSLEEFQPNDDIKYVAEIKMNKATEFLGILNKELSKEMIGKYKYENGDIYLGEYKNNAKHGYGIYIYKSDDKNEPRIQHIYIGNWENGQKKGEGIYIFNHADSPKNLGNENYELILGNFDNDLIPNDQKVTSFIKSNDNKIIYYGKINESGAKEDDQAYFIENYQRCFKGKFENDLIKEGDIFFIDENLDENGRCFHLKFEEGKEEPTFDQHTDYQIKDDLNNFMEKLKRREIDTRIIEKIKDIDSMIEIKDINAIQSLKIEDFKAIVHDILG